MKIQRLNRNRLQINTKDHINNIVLEKDNNIKSSMLWKSITKCKHIFILDQEN
jgi:hypothetical protein